jgi:hypothetical protein
LPQTFPAQFGVQRHDPFWHDDPPGHVPHEPPQLFSPQLFPLQFGMQTHEPF